MVIYLVYNLILLLLSPLIAALLAQRYLSGKSRPGWAERWGHLPPNLRRRQKEKPRLWFHAVSAGEVVAAVPILRELRARLPEAELIFSVITPAGMEMATQQAAPFVDALFYFPFDLPWVAKRVARTLQPEVFVSLESELWPNVLFELNRAGAATVMVNGRISDKNYRRSRRFGGLLFRWMLSHVDRLLMQSAADAERVRALGGGLSEPGRVAVLGNSKFDQALTRLSAEETRALRRELRLPESAPVFVAGSTRSQEEEQVVFAAYRVMQARVPELCLVIAPRQIDRAEAVVAAMQAVGFEPQRRTQSKDQPRPADTANGEVRHLVLDTLGELANVYAVAAITFVGNSFPPVVKGGGQNLLQPLAHGKPVLFGPLTATIRSEAALAQEAGVGFRVQSAEEMAETGLRLLENEAMRREIEAHALDLIAANRGVSARYAEAITELLGHPAPPFERVTPASAKQERAT